jgi:hypothetical protein
MKAKLKQGQRLLVRINGISLYTSRRQVVAGIGDFTTVNQALSQTLRVLENDRRTHYEFGKTMPTGLVHRISFTHNKTANYDIQMDMVS